MTPHSRHRRDVEQSNHMCVVRTSHKNPILNHRSNHSNSVNRSNRNCQRSSRKTANRGDGNPAARIPSHSLSNSWSCTRKNHSPTRIRGTKLDVARFRRCPCNLSRSSLNSPSSRSSMSIQSSNRNKSQRPAGFCSLSHTRSNFRSPVEHRTLEQADSTVQWIELDTWFALRNGWEQFRRPTTQRRSVSTAYAAYEINPSNVTNP